MATTNLSSNVATINLNETFHTPPSSPTTTSAETKRELDLLELPEEVIRMIFGFLNNGEVYFKLRMVCRKLCDLVENYIELGQYFPQHHK